MNITHDKEADVLYISFIDPPQPGIAVEFVDDCFIRVSNKDVVVGITIMDFDKKMRDNNVVENISS